MALKEEPEKPENHERWLLSYADFITLLMIFFIILYSMSAVDSKKYAQLAGSLNVSLNGGEGVLNQSIVMENVKSNDILEEKRKLEAVKKKIEEYLKANNLDKAVKLDLEERGLVISLKDTVLFDTGRAEILPDSMLKLIEIGNTLTSIDNYIRIEGHTDNIPINTRIYKSNWDLSVLRATNVVHLLINSSHIHPQRLSAIGYGEFRPLSDNSTPEGRSSNRRVDIVIIKNKYNETENNKTENTLIENTNQ